MNEKIKAYSKCEFHIENPKIRFSTADMKGEIIADQTLEKQFVIQSENEVPISGNVEAFDHRIELVDGSFHTTSYAVTYRVSAKGMEAGQTITGAFHVLTNGGEYDVPYEFQVVASKIDFGGAAIHNLDEFAQYAARHYDEALKLFTRDDFVSVLCAGEQLESYRRIYDSLRKSSFVTQAMDEFLVTVGAQSRTVVEPVYSHVNVVYDKEDVSVMIPIRRSGFGYIDMKISCDSACVFLAKTDLTRDDFIGDQAEIPIVVAIDELPNTVSKIPVIFSNIYGSFEVVLMVHSKTGKRANVKSDIIFAPSHLKKVYQKQLVYDYLDYRMGKITLQEYTSRSIDSCNELMKFEEQNHWYRLIRLHMYIMRKDNTRVLQEMETIEHYRDKMITDDFSECYYMYLCALEEKSGDMIDGALREIKEVYHRCPDQFLLFFMILYLDEQYEEDRQLIHDECKKLYHSGNNSPMLYYEACELYNEYPNTLRELGSFELKTLVWGFRKHCVSDAVRDRFIELAQGHTAYNQKTFYILDTLYKEHPDENLLQVICIVLMKGNCLDSKYHHYYALGVERSFKMIGLMEYYIKSIDTTDYSVLPQQVILYFDYEKERLNEEQLSYLYANIVSNKKAYESSYKDYIERIQRFMIHQVERGNMNEHLVIIYKEFLNDPSVMASVAKQLPNIMFKYRLTCENPDITTVLVDYDECNVTKRVALVNGTAYIDLITDRANITLVDKHHRRYIGSIPYNITKIIEDEKFLPICYEAEPDTFSVLLRLAYYARKAQLVDYEVIKVYKALLEYKEISDSYRQYLNGAILHYYYEQYEGDIFEEYLVGCDLSLYDEENCNLAIQYMIDRELYELATNAVRTYGYYRLPMQHMRELCNALVEAENVEYDDLIVTMAYELFYANQYSESILKYLIRYAKGGNRELIAIYKAAKQLKFDTLDLEERIVEQAIISDEYDNDSLQAFEGYLKKKTNRFLVEAYLNIMAKRFFIEHKDVPVNMIDCWITGYRSGNGTQSLMRAALLFALSQNIEVARQYKEDVVLLIDEFAKKDMLFPFMKAFEGIVELPKELYVKSFLIYEAEPNHQVNVHFYIKGPKRPQTHTERMREYFAGYYVKDFVLFADDSLVYYVTDEYEDQTIRIEEKEIPLQSYLIGNKESRFSMINALLQEKNQMQDEVFLEMLHLYIKDVYLIESNMTLL